MFKTQRANAPAAKRARQTDINFFDGLSIFIFILIIVWVYICYVSLWHPVTTAIRSNEPNQTLYTWQEDFFKPDVFSQMKGELVESKLAMAPNALDEDNFGHTSGVVIAFNLEGEHHLRNKLPLAEVLRFFDAIRLNGTNAYVINILRAMAQTEASPHARHWWLRGRTKDDRTPTTELDTAAGAHEDDTLPIWDMPWKDTTFVSYQTTVLYLQVPEDMVGGELVITEKDDQGRNLHTKVALRPKENAVLAFRGDATHRVDKFTTATNKARVSLVVEQYKVPSEHYDKVRRFWSSSRL